MQELIHDFRERQKSKIPEALIAELKTFGECDWAQPWQEYSAFELTTEKAEHLEKIVELDFIGIFNDDVDDRLYWSPVHAWRILATKNQVSSIPVLIERLVLDVDDDFARMDIPKALVKFGPAAIDPIIKEFKEEIIHPDEVYNYASMLEALEEISENYPSEKNRIIDFMIEELGEFETKSPVLNAFFVSSLVDLDDTRAAAVILKAYERQFVDEDVIDWAFVKEKFTSAPELPEKVKYFKYNPNEFHFSGDDKLQKILNVLGVSSDHECVKFMSLGYILSIDMVQPSRVLSELLNDDDGEEVVFRTEGQALYFYREFFSLWNFLTSFQDQVFTFPVIDFEGEEKHPEGIFNSAKRHWARQYLESFIQGLSLGNTDVERLAGTKASEFLEFIEQSIEELDEDENSDANSTQSTNALINKITSYWNENYLGFAKECKSIRLAHLERAKFAKQNKDVGRNDACPCGSGKKFKKCCLVTH